MPGQVPFESGPSSLSRWHRMSRAFRLCGEQCSGGEQRIAYCGENSSLRVKAGGLKSARTRSMLAGHAGRHAAGLPRPGYSNITTTGETALPHAFTASPVLRTLVQKWESVAGTKRLASSFVSDVDLWPQTHVVSCQGSYEGARSLGVSTRVDCTVTACERVAGEHARPPAAAAAS